MNLLIAIVVVLAVIAIAQLIRTFELTSKLKDSDQATVDFAENRARARWFPVFGLGYFAFFGWLVYEYGDLLLPEAASEHGESIDLLLDFNFVIIIIAFIITHILLFYFSSKYYWNPKRKAEFITHNNKLELVWTSFPAIVLAIIIIYGLTTWNEITSDAPEDAINIELYSKQFDWTARYGGSDNELGRTNFNFINATNPLGLITPRTIKTRQEEIGVELADLKKALEEAPKGGKKDAELTEAIARKTRQLKKINAFEKKHKANPSLSAKDDKLVKVEFHIPVGKPVAFQMRSQDVIHSAYMPHFRAQMNTVPGTVTRFKFTPTITTAEMRLKTGNPDFNYILLCNKICGAAHYNMQMDIIVETEEQYNKWLAEQKAFEGVENTASEEAKENKELAVK